MERKRRVRRPDTQPNRNVPGADIDSAPSFLAIAEITSPRGTKGEVKATILTDFPERLPGLKTVFIEEQPFGVDAVRIHHKQVLIKFKGIDSIEAADTLRNKIVEIPLKDAAPLPEDHFYYFQIVGLDVVTTDGKELGQVSEIIQTASNDVYVAKDKTGKELLIPAIDDVVKAIELEKHRIVIELVEGLL